MKRSSILYWSLVVALVAFGYLALFSIGAPFLLTGLALAALWPARRRPQTFWPVLIGVQAFVVGYVLVTPLWCRGEESPAGNAGSTECFNLIGIDYSGSASYNPPLWPALIAGLAAGLAVALLARWLALRLQREAGVA